MRSAGLLQWVFLSMAVLAGGGLALQAAINANLGRELGHPVSAAMLSFAVGTLLLFAYVLVLRLPLPSLGRISALPWWSWLAGGFLGAYFVSASTTLAPRLGVAVFFMAMVAGQITVAILLDHKGWLGLPERPVSAGRLAGVACMIAGIYLTRRF
jgi:transporter family-2 protein